jgi:hypothetical protein
MKKIRKKWLRLSAEKNALDFLVQAHHHIQRTDSDVFAWKWVILSLYGALYGFAVCALKGTSLSRVTFRTRKGNQRLISFGEAVKRCQDPSWMHLMKNSRHLELSPDQQESIRWLKDGFRDCFEHFIPKGWSIEVHGFPKIVLDVLNVIRFLALDTGNYIRLKESEKRKIKSVVFQSKRWLGSTKLYREARIAGAEFVTYPSAGAATNRC